MLPSVLYQQMGHHATHEILPLAKYWQKTEIRLIWQGRDKGPYIYTHPPVLHDALYWQQQKK